MAGGRASIARQQRDILKTEVKSLRAESREMARDVIPLAAHLWRAASISGDPKTKVAAGRIVYFARRLAERGGDDAA